MLPAKLSKQSLGDPRELQYTPWVVRANYKGFQKLLKLESNGYQASGVSRRLWRPSESLEILQKPPEVVPCNKFILRPKFLVSPPAQTPVQVHFEHETVTVVQSPISSIKPPPHPQEPHIFPFSSRSNEAAPSAPEAMIAILSFVVAFLAPQAAAVIGGDLNCTTYNGTAFVWTPAATACANNIADSSCAVLYPAPVTADGYPSPGKDQQRPLACYTTATATPAGIVQDMKAAALSNCARTCGLCCQTNAYNCANVAYPRLNCATITNAQCLSSTWRTIIAQDCPSACGFCNQGGCVDGVTDCANDITICNAVGLQTFVNTYCQRTCGRCASSTTAASSSSTCTSYIPNSSTACASWAANGFCTNTFYTLAQRRAYCATTCRIC